MSRFIILLIIAYPFFFIWQGLDFTDSGFMLTNFQQIFNDSTSIEASFRIWLTNVVGGIWVCFFGDSLGLVGYRLAGVLIAWAALFVSYLTLKPYFRQTQLLWGLLLALIVINRSGFRLDYNSLSGLCYTLTGYFLIKGLVKGGHGNYLFLAGLIAGLNIFVKLPNLLGVSLSFAIIYFAYLNKETFQSTRKMALHFSSGFGLGLIGVLLIMSFKGDFWPYLEALKGTFSMLGNANSHHSSSKLTSQVMTQQLRVVMQFFWMALLIFALSLLLTLAAKITRTKVQAKIVQAGVPLSFFSLLVSFYFLEFQNWFKFLVSLVGGLYFFLVLRITGIRPWEIEQEEKEAELRVVAFVAFIVLLVLPLGSNLGLHNAVYGMYLALPIAYCTFLNIKQVKLLFPKPVKCTLQLREGEVKAIKLIVITMLFFLSVNSTFHYSYRDTSHRQKLVYGIDNKHLKGVLTTKERAKVVEELLAALPNYVNEDDYLLAYEQIPLVHFLTKTRPYLYSSWPMLYDSRQFDLVLQRAQRENKKLPVIVRAKGSTESFVWPRTVKLKQHPNLQKIRFSMENFISENNYKQAWENGFFEVLTPSKE